MKYAFYVSARAGRLVRFLRQAETRFLKEIVVVVADREVVQETKDVFAEYGIPLVEFPYKKILGDNSLIRNRILSNCILNTLHEYYVDYCFSFGSHILSGDLLKVYNHRLINFHPALLPMYPGKRAIEQAREHGNTLVVGNTAHFVDEGVDTGKIIMQSAITLRAFEDAGCDYEIILGLQVEMLNRLMSVIDDGRLEIVDGNPRIRGAIYDKPAYFPEMNGGGGD